MRKFVGYLALAAVLAGCGAVPQSPGSAASAVSSTAQTASIMAVMSATGATASIDPTMTVNQIFSRLDSNGDGKLSLAEFTAGFAMSNLTDAQIQALFTKLDSNQDGYLEPNELLSPVLQANAASQAEPSAGMRPERGRGMRFIRHRRPPFQLRAASGSLAATASESLDARWIVRDWRNAATPSPDASPSS
ncbi:MAG: EF-hand domain-containing protein [Cyanobacteria bacterium REEB65]|nr:EF-hand domain-containing protein [Cyanobacteria bacterium REEB65]